jgi:hypothetical protein
MAVVGNFAAPVGKFGIMLGNYMQLREEKTEKWIHCVRKLLLF